MICPKCNTRFVDFPEEIFKFANGDLVLKKKNAKKMRIRMFESDKEEICLSCMVLAKEDYIFGPKNLVPLVV